MTDIDFTAANNLAAEALALIKAELNLPPRPVVEPNAVALIDAAEQLDKQLTLWADRATGSHAPGVTRQASTDAVTTLDFMVAQAHRMRERLIGQMRVYDDATSARVDALLAELRTRSSDTMEGETDG